MTFTYRHDDDGQASAFVCLRTSFSLQQNAWLCGWGFCVTDLVGEAWLNWKSFGDLTSRIFVSLLLIIAAAGKTMGVAGLRGAVVLVRSLK